MNCNEFISYLDNLIYHESINPIKDKFIVLNNIRNEFNYIQNHSNITEPKEIIEVILSDSKNIDESFLSNDDKIIKNITENFLKKLLGK